MKKHLISASIIAVALAATTMSYAQELSAEVIHQWVSAGEAAGVKVLADEFGERGGTWIDNAIAGGPAARSAAMSRTLGGDPPAAMLFNTGAQFVELADNGLLRDLSETAAADAWADKLPKPMLDMSTRDGKVFALPISGNGANWFWFSKAALEQLGATTPTNWDETFIVLDKAKEAGLIPFAMSGIPRWERLTFNAIVLGVAGKAVFDDVVTNQNPEAVRSPEFRKAVETFQRLKDYVDGGSAGRDWADSVNLVITDKALMAQSGTWANGAFLGAGEKSGVDYECAIINPEAGMVLSGDVFLFPQLNDEAGTKAQDVLMQVFADPEVQTTFATQNGTIPIMKGADTSGLDPCIQSASEYFADPGKSSLSDQIMFTPAAVGVVEDAITRFWNGSDLTVDQFIEAYATGITQ